ncbi:MAG: hypothetical protein NTV29_12315, partial [Planctomycetota bacterium]|nr:hypothetical protein [Planctomycetota bacterium]
RLFGSGSPVEIRLFGSGSPEEIRLFGSGSPVEIRLFGFSPDGDTSLPLVRKPPEPGNKTTILYSSDAPASISDTSQFNIYRI